MIFVPEWHESRQVSFFCGDLAVVKKQAGKRSCKMAKDLFKEKFEQDIKSYPKNYEGEYTKEMENIGKIIGDSICSRKYVEFFKKNEENFLKSLTFCNNYELDCDAIDYLEEHIFEGNYSSINTTNCPKWEDFNKEIKDYLAPLPKRGFIYIAWQDDPLKVYYIGMTGDSDRDRLNLRNHGQLSRAVEKGATRFTIIFPDRSNNIENAERSFIRIIKKLGYEILNSQEGAPDKLYDRDIHELQKFIDKVMKIVQKFED